MTQKSPDIFQTLQKVHVPSLTLSIVVPAYNESDNLIDALRMIETGIPDYVSDYEIIVVDDGSEDDTSVIIRDLAAKNQRIIGVYHSLNQGKGAALQSGFKKAHLEWVLFTDADLQINIAELPAFLNQIESFDIIIGARQGRKDPFSRILSSAIYAAIIRLLLGFTVRDLNCPFKLFRKEFIESYPLHSKGFFVDTELLYIAFKEGLRIKELEVDCQPRQKGESTVRLRHVLETVRELFELLGRRKSIGR